MGLWFFRDGVAAAQQTPSKTVEVVVQGIRYKSIRDYKREQVKDILTRTLSSQDLREFSEEELCGIIHEVQQRQTTGSLPNGTPVSTSQQPGAPTRDLRGDEEHSRDPDVMQMREMLKSYLEEHKEAAPVVVNPDKVKNIIVEPKE